MIVDIDPKATPATVGVAVGAAAVGAVVGVDRRPLRLLAATSGSVPDSCKHYQVALLS